MYLTRIFLQLLLGDYPFTSLPYKNTLLMAPHSTIVGILNLFNNYTSRAAKFETQLVELNQFCCSIMAELVNQRDSISLIKCMLLREAIQDDFQGIEKGRSTS